MQKASDRPVKKKSEAVSIIINLLVVYSLLAISYNIYPNLYSIYNIIIIGYTILISIAVVISLLAVAMIGLYLLGLSVWVKSATDSRDILVANKSQNLEDYDLNTIKESILKFNPGKDHIDNINFVFSRFNKKWYMIRNYIFTISISVLAFQLGMYYLFTVEVASLIVIEIMRLQASGLLHKINNIFTIQQELKDT